MGHEAIQAMDPEDRMLMNMYILAMYTPNHRKERRTRSIRNSHTFTNPIQSNDLNKFPHFSEKVNQRALPAPRATLPFAADKGLPTRLANTLKAAKMACVPVT